MCSQIYGVFLLFYSSRWYEAGSRSGERQLVFYLGRGLSMPHTTGLLKASPVSYIWITMEFIFYALAYTYLIRTSSPIEKEVNDTNRVLRIQLSPEHENIFSLISKKKCKLKLYFDIKKELYFDTIFCLSDYQRTKCLCYTLLLSINEKIISNIYQNFECICILS